MPRTPGLGAITRPHAANSSYNHEADGLSRLSRLPHNHHRARRFARDPR